MLAVPQLTTEAMVDAAETAASEGHVKLAFLLFEALMARDWTAATEVLAEQSVAEEVFVRWQAAEDIIREEEARWPELQQLLIEIAGTHQQLQLASRQQPVAAGISVSATNAASPDVAAAAVPASVADVAPLAQHPSSSAAATVTTAMPAATPLPAGGQERVAATAIGEGHAGNTALAGDLHAQQGPDTTTLAEAFSGMHT
jgi:hypothetical protein